MNPGVDSPQLTLEIKLLGAFELKVGGVPRARVPAAVQALLALLVLNARNPLGRQALASALWPEVSAEQASFYLRRSLSQLRALLGDASGRIGADLSLDLSGCRCDLTEFERDIESDPEAAIASYGGRLAVGKRNHRFEAIAQELADKHARALAGLAERLESAGDSAGAIRLVRQILSEDRTSEAAWRSLIRLLGSQHDHVGAARAFRQLRLALREETGMEPSPETTAVYHQVMAESDALRVRPVEVAKPKLRNPRLPTPLTSLIGREADIQGVNDALERHRLLFIVGLGGVGKTRLAIEIAERRPKSASVSIAGEIETEELESTLAMESLFPGSSDGEESLLLLIDHVEHVLDPLRSSVERLLTDHPNLKIVATSRRAVDWPGVHLHHLSPLQVAEPSGRTVAEISEIPAVKLFVERARAADAQFSLSARNVEPVTRICAKLDGLPLALELAAAKVQSMSVSEIDRRLDDRFALLTRRGSGQTLETVLAWSFEGLAEPERKLLIDLVQLPGTWAFEAIEAIGVEDALQSVESLVALDLLVFQGGRYRCLQTVREYVARKGEPSPNFLRGVAEYYFAEVETRFPALEASLDGQVFEWFAQEEPNLTWVLQKGIRSADADLRSQVLALGARLHHYWMRSGKSALGLRIGLGLIEDQTEPSPELTSALYSVGGLALHTSRREIAERAFERADAMAEHLGLSSWRAESLLMRAELLSVQAKLSESAELLQEALGQFRELGNLSKQAWCLRSLGYVERERGRFPEALDLTRQALKIYSETNESAGRIWCIGSLGAIWLQAGDPAQALPYFLENAATARANGDVSTAIWNLTISAEAEKELGDLDAASGHVREALLLHGPEQEMTALEWPTSLLGEILTKQGDYAAAEQTLDRAWQCHCRAGTSKLGAYTMLRRAELHRRWGKLESARAYFAIAEELVRTSEVEDLSVQLEALRTALSGA